MGYKQTEVGVIPAEWDVASIGSLASFRSGDGISIGSLADESPDAPIPVYGGNGIAEYTNRALVRDSVVVGRVGQKCGEVYLTRGPAWITDNALYPRSLRRRVDVRFLALALKAAGLNSVKNRNDLPLVTQSILHSVRIPLPPSKAEEEAIAGALSDADALIESLEQLLLRLIRRLGATGWRVELIYLSLPNAEMAKLRVAERVRHGGHDIPVPDIERRFLRSLENLFGAYAVLADRTVCFHNSGETPEIVFTQQGGRIAR